MAPIIHPVIVPLQHVEVRDKAGTLSLSLASSFSLTRSSGWNQVPTPAELTRSSQEGDLWVARAGSCQVDICILVNGGATATEPIVLQRLAQRVSKCPIWEEMGLNLQAKYHDGPHGRTRGGLFLLQSLGAPGGPSPPLSQDTANFETLTCVFNIEATPVKPPPHASPDPDVTVAIKKEEPDEPPMTFARQRYGLRPRPPVSTRKSKSFDSSRHADVVVPKKEGPPDQSPDQSPDIDLCATSVALLANAALQELMGVRRATPGVTVPKGHSSNPLTVLAPAVWNQPYAQSLASHMDLVPVISTALAQLSNSPSPELRRKLAQLTTDGAASGWPSRCDDDGDGFFQGDMVKSEMQERLWRLCQVGVQAKPAAKKKRKERTARPSNTQGQDVVMMDLTDSQQSFESVPESQQSLESEWRSQQSFGRGMMDDDDDDNKSVFLLELEDGTFMTATRLEDGDGDGLVGEGTGIVAGDWVGLADI